MKISEVIEKLSSIQEEYGDIDVAIERDYRDFPSVENVETAYLEYSEEEFAIIK